tara:strand:- start:11330 stop:11689 length:360 start_codon:yes stop_codon:yes gene_type:complete
MGGLREEVQEGVESAKQRARQYKREKLDEQTRAAQRNVGAVSGDAMSSFEMATEGVGDFIERNTRSMPGRAQGGDSPETSDTASANYSKSSSEKSSKTDKKGQKESKGGTGGSKRQFYA